MLRQLRRYTIGTAKQSGRLLRYFGLENPKLSSHRLLTAAQELAQWDQWGDPDPNLPLTLLCQDFETDAELHLPGRIAARFDLLRLLKHRLEIEKVIADNPPITQQPIKKPIFVVGLPRTGTTMLQNLLASDPRHRSPLTWETMQPVIAASRHARQHAAIQRKVASQLLWLDALAPDFHRIHAVKAGLPQECLVITAHALHSYQFQTTHYVPRYQSWLQQQSRSAAYRYHRRFLQHMQWQAPTQRWVLKAPAHLFGLSELLEIYPDACIIQTHREPTEVMSSLASLTIELRGAFSDRHDARQIGPEVIHRWSQALASALLTRDQKKIPSERIFDVDYHQLTTSPLNTLQQIYAHFELDWQPQTAASQEAWLTRNPKHRHGHHQHTLTDFGLQTDWINEHFSAYRQRFLRPSAAAVA